MGVGDVTAPGMKDTGTPPPRLLLEPATESDPGRAWAGERAMMSAGDLARSKIHTKKTKIHNSRRLLRFDASWSHLTATY